MLNKHMEPVQTENCFCYNERRVLGAYSLSIGKYCIKRKTETLWRKLNMEETWSYEW